MLNRIEALPDLLSAAEELERLASLNRQEAVRQAARELAEKIRQNRFHLVVVGQFKRGKTTLLNALLGAPLLPVGMLPLTSVLTVLRYRETPGATVHFEDERQREIELGELAEFVTESGNPRNHKRVARVEVFYPSSYLREGVVLIDTPGVASVYTHNTRLTYDFLPRIDAALFVTSPEPPLTSAELEFLEDLSRHVRRVFLVMNKADLVSPDEMGEVLRFLQRSLPEGFVGDGDRIFTLSARQALDARLAGDAQRLEQSGLAALEQRLRQFLEAEKEQVLLTSVAERLLQAARELRMLLEFEIRALRMPLEQLREKIAEFERQLASAWRQREDDALLLKGGLARLSAAFESAAKEFAAAQSEPLLAAAGAHFRSLPPMSRRKLAAAMDRFVADNVARLFDQWRREFESRALEEFRRLTGRFQDAVNTLIRQVRQTAGDLFGVPIEPFQAAEQLTEMEPTGYYTDRLLDWGLGNAPLLLPGPLFRRYLWGRVRGTIPEELERNATRVAYDFKRRLEKSVRVFEQALDRKLSETIQGLRLAMEAALERQQAGAAQAEQLAAGLSGSIRELERLGERIRGWVPASGAGPSPTSRPAPVHSR